MAVEFLVGAQSTFYAIERQHYRCAGVIGMPVYALPLADNPAFPNGALAAVPTPCRVVRLHAPIERHFIKWACVKEGAAPIAPNPYLLDANMTFKDGWVSGAIPVMLAGYTGHAWSMAGTYEYIMSSPTDLNSDMPLGLEPWEPTLNGLPGLALADSKMPAANFVNYLLEALRSGGSGPGG